MTHAATAIRWSRIRTSPVIGTRRGFPNNHNECAFVHPFSQSAPFHSSARVERRANKKKNGVTDTYQKLRREKFRLLAKTKKPKEKEFFRADRVLAQRSKSTRSECFDLLQQKRVWTWGFKSAFEFENHKVKAADSNNDEEGWVLIPGPKTKLSMTTPLWIDRSHAVPMPPPLVMAYHKPKWVLSVTTDPRLSRPCLDETIVPSGMHPVGRLDYDSSGLLLFSSSGPLTQRLLHPKHAIPKVYEVVVTNTVDREKLNEELTVGVKTGEGIHTAELLEVEPWDAVRVAPYLDSVRANIPTHYNQTDLEERGYLDIFKAMALTTVTLRVQEGKHRMVRRIMANCGHPVVTLTRKKFGEISLDDLPETSLRPVTPQEEAWLDSILKKK